MKPQMPATLEVMLDLVAHGEAWTGAGDTFEAALKGAIRSWETDTERKGDTMPERAFEVYTFARYGFGVHHGAYWPLGTTIQVVIR